MQWQPPAPSQAWESIEIYLSLAYDAAPPSSVAARLDVLRSIDPSQFYSAAPFERATDPDVTRYALRLGNRFYPHMKLIIERAPDHSHALFRADTHDRHVLLASNSPEAAAFAELSRNNQELAQRIEAAWDEHRLPTFKQYLRDDLARRKAAAEAQSPV